VMNRRTLFTRRRVYYKTSSFFRRVVSGIVTYIPLIKRVFFNCIVSLERYKRKNILTNCQIDGILRTHIDTLTVRKKRVKSVTTELFQRRETTAERPELSVDSPSDMDTVCVQPFFYSSVQTFWKNG